MLTGEAPLWPTKVPFTQLECPHARSLRIPPVCLVNVITLSLHRRNPRSPCVGIDGYFVRGDMTSLSLLLKALQSRKA